MSVISFNSLNKYGQCAQYLKDLAKDEQDPSLQLTVVTGAGLRVEEAAAAAQSAGAGGSVRSPRSRHPPAPHHHPPGHRCRHRHHDDGACAHWADKCGYNWCSIK